MHRARGAGRARQPLPRSRVARDERARAYARESRTAEGSRLSIDGSENFGNPRSMPARRRSSRRGGEEIERSGE